MANELSIVKVKLTCALQEIKTLRDSFFKIRTENARLKSLLRANNVFDDAEPSDLQTSRDGQSLSDEQELTPILMKPIGHIESSFANKRAVPRQPTIMNNVHGTVVISKTVFNNPEHALDGLQEYSHMWILFHFHQNEGVGGAKVAPPRLRGERLGVFSTRAPHRPCPIGLSLVQITAIEGNRIQFAGVDMVNGTPVLDVKPYIPQYDMPGPSRPYTPQYDMPGPSGQTVYPSSPSQDPQNLSNSTAPSTQISTSPNLSTTTVNTQNSSITNTTVSTDLYAPTTTTPTIEDPHTPNSSSEMSISEEFLTPNSTNTDNTMTPNSIIIRDNRNTSFLNDVSFTNYNFCPYDSSTPDRSRSDSSSAQYVTGQNMSLSPNSNSTTLSPELTYRMASGHYLHRCFSGQMETGDSDYSASPVMPALNNQSSDGNDASSETSVVNMRDNIRGSPDGQEMFGRVPAPAEVEVRVATWVNQRPTYTVRFTDHALALLEGFLEDRAPAFRANIERLLAEDPRSQYIRTRYPDSPYNCVLEELSICCVFDEESAVCTVTTVRDSIDM